MNNFDRLKLLMWKYLQFRKHYWIMTVVEICLPIVLVYGVIKINQSWIDTSPILVRQPNDHPDSEALQSFWSYELILFTPNNEDTQMRMQQLRLYVDAVAKKRLQVRGVENENDMVLEISKSKIKNITGVVFLEISNRLLHYKIRDKNVYHTSERFFENDYEDLIRFHEHYLNTGFLSLQGALASIYTGGSQGFESTSWGSFFLKAYTVASDSRAVLPIILGFVIVLTSLMISGPLLVTIMSEKECGTKDLMKIVGISEKLLWLSWFLSWLIIGIIVCTGVTFLLKLNFIEDRSAVFNHTRGSIVWTCILLFYIAQVAFSFVFTAIFHRAMMALPSLFVTTAAVSYLAFQFHKWHNSIFVHLSCLVPAGAFMQGITRFAHYEKFGDPLAWNTLFANEITVTDASVGFVFLLLILDTIVYLFLAYYISSINPNQYGLRKSQFLISAKDHIERYKNRRKKSIIDRQKIRKTEEPQNPLVETSPNAEISLGLKHLQKNFGYVQAVKDVNLTLYKNEILALLGHTGSGKTTTLAMLAGLTEPTSGQILFRGNIDLLLNMKEFRKNIGICPQEDSLFPYLTVMDHLLFFGMLKGATEEEAEEEAKEYLNLMHMESNADDMVAVVSKDMKRKLSVSMALMGKADILLLDEPMAGLDPQSKKRIQHLLLKLKPNRTVIFTSQFMNEAETFADRIAIMNQGLTVAHGSSNFLKKTFGIGYRLRLIKKPASQVNVKAPDAAPQLIELITKTVPGSKLERRSVAEFVFSLPASETARFPPLIRTLESRKTALNIDHVIMSGTTLEQVFQKLGGESIYDSHGKLLMPSSVVEDPLMLPRTEKKIGWNLVLIQHQALFMKKVLYLYRNAISFVLRVTLPTILMILMMVGTMKFEHIDPPLELTIQAVYPGARVMFLKYQSLLKQNFDFDNLFVSQLREMGAHVLIAKEKNLKTAMLNYANENIRSYRRELLFASEFPNPTLTTELITFFNHWARHTFPILLATLNNVQSEYRRGHKDYKRTLVINHPVKPVNVTLITDKFNTQEHSPILWVWFILLAFFTIDLLDYFVMLVKVERIDGFKQIQLLSSVSPRTYWINNFAFDFIFFFIIIFGRILVFHLFDLYGFFSFKRDLLVVYLLVFLFIASGLLFIYNISFVTTSKSEYYVLFFLFNFMCSLISVMYYRYQTALLSGSPTSSLGHAILYVAKYVILLVPPINFSLAILKYVMAWRVNHMVEAYAQHGLEDKQFKAEDYQPYLQTTSFENPNGILEEACFMVIDIVLYSGILFIIESGFIGRFINSIKYRKEDDESDPPAADTSNIPSEVQDERNKVAILSETMNDDPTMNTKTENVLLVHGLQKIYERLILPSVIAVNNVTFVVRAGECFGVLGLSGAGKTTTIKMLTGEISPSRGESWILNVKLSENRTEYFSKTGYCAQTNCFLEELTGKETLNLIASLRGVSSADREVAIDKWISILDLEAFENKKCSQYGEGDRRKICTAMAMIGDPNVMFLDEPTSGIDPISRRRLYKAIIQTKLTGKAIALTSHSIEECETLCDRLTILVKGDMKFIGTTEELRQKYGIGFSLIIKLADPVPGETEDLRTEMTEVLKKLFSVKFKPGSYVLKEETKSLLRYRIENKMPLADSFQKMEELKNDQKIIAEYFLTEVSLEEVFSSFVENSS